MCCLNGLRGCFELSCVIFLDFTVAQLVQSGCCHTKNVSRFIDFFLVELSPIYADMQEHHLKKIMSLHSGSFADI